MYLNDLAAAIHANSRAKGFWPKAHNCNIPEDHTCGHGPCDFTGRDPLGVVALIHSEATECVEAIRDDKWAETVSWHNTPYTAGPEMKIEDGKLLFKRVGLEFDVDWVEATPVMLERWGYIGKPEGVASELADIIIRTLDAAAAWGIDIEKAVQLKVAYNETREILHGRAR